MAVGLVEALGGRRGAVARPRRRLGAEDRVEQPPQVAILDGRDELAQVGLHQRRPSAAGRPAGATRRTSPAPRRAARQRRARRPGRLTTRTPPLTCTAAPTVAIALAASTSSKTFEGSAACAVAEQQAQVPAPVAARPQLGLADHEHAIDRGALLQVFYEHGAHGGKRRGRTAAAQRCRFARWHAARSSPAAPAGLAAPSRAPSSTPAGASSCRSTTRPSASASRRTSGSCSSRPTSSTPPRRPRSPRSRPATRDAPLGAVVNLVGGFAMGGRVHETPVEDFEAQLRLNLRPTYLVCQAALPHLLAAGGGAIVCVSSRAALKPFAGAAGYVVAKAAMLSFVDVLATEYRDDGIRANAILPSVIDTPANRRSMPDADFERWVAPDADRGGRALPLRGRLRRRQRRARAGLRPRSLSAAAGRAAGAPGAGVTAPRPRVQSSQCTPHAASCSPPCAGAVVLAAAPAGASPPLPSERDRRGRQRRRRRPVRPDRRPGHRAPRGAQRPARARQRPRRGRRPAVHAQERRPRTSSSTRRRPPSARSTPVAPRRARPSTCRSRSRTRQSACQRFATRIDKRIAPCAARLEGDHHAASACA